MTQVRHLDDDTALCLRCDSGDVDYVDCHLCGGEGGFDEDTLMEEDPLWNEGVEWEKCHDCNGEGGHWVCYACQRTALKARGVEVP